MMKIHFNRFERMAGVFLLTAIAGVFVAGISAAVKQGWFEKKVYFHTTFENADGIHSGTMVQMAGLRAGAVEDVELQGDNRIRVLFYVHGKFRDRIKEDSSAQLVRPFVIGDRVLEVTVGSESNPVLAEQAMMRSEETLDIMTLMSGKKLGNSLSRLTGLLENVQNLAESFLSKNRTESMVRIFDRLDPLLDNMNVMSVEVVKLSRQATNNNNLKTLMSQAAVLTQELNRIIPEMNRQNPEMAKQLASLTGNLSEMTQDLRSLTVMMKDFGPEIPATARRAMEALNEATVLMKALQKSFVLRGNVREVREEEAQRKPATANP